MVAQVASLQIKPNIDAVATAKQLEKDLIPLLEKQDGFEGFITLVTSDKKEALAISLWETQMHLNAYMRDCRPRVLNMMSKLVDVPPVGTTYDVFASDVHSVAAHVMA